MEKRIVLDNLDDTSVTWIEQESKRRGLPIEQITLELIQQAIQNARLKTYHDLDALAGTWTDKEADEFLSVIADFERVDESLWQ